MIALFQNGTATGQKSATILVGNYTVIAADDTANTKTIDLSDSMAVLEGGIVQVMRANKVVTSDATKTFSGGTMTVADGSAYVLTTGDILHYIVWGSQAN